MLRGAGGQRVEGGRTDVPQPAHGVAADPSPGARAENRAIRASRSADHAHAKGKTLFELAWPLVEAIDSLGAKFAARRGGIDAGRLDIAAGESTLLYLLPPFIKEFADRYPAIELKLHNVTGRDGVAMLRADQVDFAVGPMTEEGEGMDYRDMFAAEPMLITARDHPLAKKKEVTIREVAAYPLILPPRHLATWRVVDFVFHKHKLKYHVKLEAGGWEVIKKYVELGLGISIVASLCLTGKEALAAIPMKRYFPTRRYGVVVRRGKFLSPQAQRFSNHGEGGTEEARALSRWLDLGRGAGARAPPLCLRRRRACTARSKPQRRKQASAAEDVKKSSSSRAASARMPLVTMAATYSTASSLGPAANSVRHPASRAASVAKASPACACPP